jgi:hypothetical protein
MGLDATKALQLSVMLGQVSQLFAGPTSNQGRFAQSLIQSGQAGIQAEAIKKARKEEEKKSKSKGLGSIGSMLGTAAGFAVGGPAGAAIGASLGSAGGQAIGGGGVDPVAAGLSGLNGGFQGYSFGKSALANTVTDMTPKGLPQNYLPGDSLVQDVGNSFAHPGTMVGRAIPPTNYAVPNTQIGRQIPALAQGSPQHVGSPSQWASQFPKVGGGSTAQAGFGKRFGAALGQMSGQQQQHYSPSPYIQRTAPGQPDILWDI